MSTTTAPSHTLPPRWVRLVHWTNALAFATMLASGWQIYNAAPFWIPGFARWMTLGGSLPGALQWHFAAMWLLAGNGALAVGLLVTTGRLRKLYLPIRPAALLHDLRQLLRHPLRHGPGGQRNSVQKLAYLAAILLLALEVASGLALWKPVQLQLIATLWGGYENTRRVHFSGMALLASFAVGHIALALCSPRLLLAMLGIPLREKTA